MGKYLVNSMMKSCDDMKIPIRSKQSQNEDVKIFTVVDCWMPV